MTDLIESYKKELISPEEPQEEPSVEEGVIELTSDPVLAPEEGSFRIASADRAMTIETNGRVIMRVDENGDIHFFGNLVVHGNLTADGDIRAARVWNAVFN